MDSLEHLMDYDFAAIFCSGGKVYTPGREKLAEKIAWSKSLQINARRLLAKGLEIEAIRDQVLGSENMLAQFTEGDYSKLNMAKAVL